MGKPARKRSLPETQVKAIGRNIRISPRKLNLVAQSIRGQTAEAALATLTFSPKRIARTVKKVLESAIFVGFSSFSANASTGAGQNAVRIG